MKPLQCQARAEHQGRKGVHSGGIELLHVTKGGPRLDGAEPLLNVTPANPRRITCPLASLSSWLMLTSTMASGVSSSGLLLRKTMAVGSLS